MLAFRHRFFDKGAKPRFPNADPKKDTRSSCAYQQSRRSSQTGPREIGKHLRPILGYLIGRRRGTVFRKQTAQGVDWLQNRRIAGLREHRNARRPNERVGRYAFFLSERDQLRLFLRFQRQDDRHKLLCLRNSIAQFYMDRTALANRVLLPHP